MSEDLSKMEVRECPHCGERLFYGELTHSWIHPKNDCFHSACWWCVPEHLEKWNRRAPPRELVEAVKRLEIDMQEHRSEKAEVFDVMFDFCEEVKKLCEVKRG